METLGITLIIIALFLALIGILFKVFFRKILAKPPYVGLITFWGKRIPKYKREGYRFFADFFPFLYGFIPIKIEKVNNDLVFENIRCKIKEEELPQSERDKNLTRSGGEITVKIGLTWQPDYARGSGQRLISYIDSGSQEGVEAIISDLIEEDIRQMGKEKSWEEFTFALDDLKFSLVKKLTGEEPREGLDREMHTNGFPDIVDLGIIIWRFNVGQIKEQGKLAEAAEMQAKEIQEKRAEIYELETEIQQAEMLYNAYKDIDTLKTLEECVLEIRRRKAIREGHGTILDIPGLENLKIGNIFGGK